MGSPRAGLNATVGQSTAEFSAGSTLFSNSGKSYLTKTYAGNPTSNKIITVSVWVKVTATPNPNSAVFWGYGGSASHTTRLEFLVDGRLRAPFGGSAMTELITKRVFRDTGYGWYHIMDVYDTDQLDDRNRHRLYINGEVVAQADFATKVYPAVGATHQYIMANFRNKIGAQWNGAADWPNLNFSQMHVIDGQVLGPGYFGYTDPKTNTWRPRSLLEGDQTVNNGTTWSSFVTGAVGNANYSHAKLFDGYQDPAFNGTVSGQNVFTYPASNTTNTFTPPSPIRARQQIRVYIYRYDDLGQFWWNGVDHTATVNAVLTAHSEVGWVTMPTKTLTSMAWRWISGTGIPYMGGIEVDGVVMRDGQTATVGYGNNGFYLPFDGSDGIGIDQSGKGNDWTPYRLGSLPLDSHKGDCYPILNTVGGGNVASGGVRGIFPEIDVTVAVSKFVVDGVSQGTLNFYRGGTYRFYQGEGTNNTHPLRLASVDKYNNDYWHSVHFDGNDYLTLADSADWHFSNGAFTVECWVYPTASPNQPIIVGQWSNPYSWCLQLSNDSNRKMRFLIDTASGITDMVSTHDPVPLNTWSHLAVVRDGSNNFTFYLNGTKNHTATNSGTLDDAASVLSIGANGAAGQPFTGYISNVRVVKGTAVYTDEFEPSLVPFTAVANTKLLCCQESTVTNGAVKPGSITAGGDPAASTTYSPYLFGDAGRGVSIVGTPGTTGAYTQITVPHLAPNILYYYCNSHSGMGGGINVTTDASKADPYAWKCIFALPFTDGWKDQRPAVAGSGSATTVTAVSSPGAIGRGSVYGQSTIFDANGEKVTLTQPTAFGLGNFTIEFWVYHDQLNNYGCMGTTRADNGSHAGAWYLGNNSDGDFVFAYGPVDATTEPVFTLKKWQHACAVRRGKTLKLYVDGVEKVSNTSFTRNLTDTAMGIGNYNSGNYEQLYGNIQDYRMYTEAKYTSDFIPVSGVPDVVPDSPSGVSHESRLTKPTNGSVLFDGTGDYLSMSDSADFSMGTGDFTVEAWIYPSANASYRSIVDCRDATTQATGWILGVDVNNNLYIYNNGFLLQSGANGVPEGQWYHVCYERSGGTHTLYINGRYQVHSTSSYNYSVDNCVIGANYAKNGEYWNGWISNVRIVKGSAVYAKGSATSLTSFTVPTQPLTAVNNTKLLCCQSKESPIAAAVSPGALTKNGHSWAVGFNPFDNDINIVRGQESNYAVLSEADGAATLSNGGLTATSGTNKAQCATIAMVTGKYYWECVVDNINISQYGIVSVEGRARFLDYPPGGTDQKGYIYLSESGSSGNGYFYHNNSPTRTNLPTARSIGDVIMMAYDADTRKFWIGKNGHWFDTSNPGKSDSPIVTVNAEYAPYMPVLGAGGGSDAICSTINFGQHPFRYTPPEGFQPLNRANTQDPAVALPSEDYMKPVVYTGDGNSGRFLDFGFDPDFVMFKSRSTNGYGWEWYDTVRGATKAIYSDLANGEATESQGLLDFGVGGVTIGNNNWVNKDSSTTYVAYGWKVGGHKNTFNIDDVGYSTAAAAGLTGADIDPTGATINTKTGFSIIRYTAAADGARVPHGLGATPELLITKVTSEGSQNWSVYTNLIDGSYDYGRLNSTNGFTNSGQTIFNATTFPNIHGSGKTVINYLWRSIPGVQKFGYYQANGNTDGLYIDLGFKPGFVCFKGTSTGGSRNWGLADSTRSPFNVVNHTLAWNLNNNEAAFGPGVNMFGSGNEIDFLSNGIKIRDSGQWVNTGTEHYIYMAWAENPGHNLWGGQANAR